jgi:hypothetical protein
MTTMLERLMALYDGELVPREGAAVIREAAKTPHLEGLLATLAATARSRVGKPYAAIAAEPVPAHLVDMIMRAPLATAERKPVKQVSYGGALLASLKRRYQVPGWSMAASPAMAALLVTIGLGWLMLPTLGHGREVQASVNAALEKGEPGKDFTVASVKSVRTFPNKDGQWCRQSEVHFQGTEQMSYRLYCREHTGTWSLQAATALGARVTRPAGPRMTGDDSATPASDPRKVVNDRAEAIAGGDAVYGDEERNLIINNWPAPRRQ